MKRPQLPLNSLNTFAAAAEFSSFQIAADHLHVTASAVSHQIRNLEKLLGYQLFDRLDKRVQLTSRGEQLYSDIGNPFQELHHAIYRALQKQQNNSLRISAAPSFATRWLLPRLDGFYARHPEIDLSLVATSELVDFRVDHIDAAIRLGNGQWPQTVAKLLFEMDLVAVCRPSLLKANGGEFDLEQLTEQSLVHNSSMGGLWQSWFIEAGYTKKCKLKGVSVQNAAQSLEAIQTGDRICLIDRPFITDALNSGDLALAYSQGYSCNRGYYLTYPEDSETKTAFKVFSQWLYSELPQ
ncbi:LysR substrate-binding domain-containing protein [Motiliproteus sp. MSK22-1]|uniref:LysR substrate-binding domain-containing protein n=1 Tax=Motiliproteus sp. MSK22-1 TaxID=1897630 RepID=UPI0009789577|nr:LysR substrate-binding domain-containing protein [Motiliproteus sp. MSK22-1]OMH29070.1 hypothetical protein BGP75_20155 [Motiliproteus sp. MSK22-1]